jgi:hypothetical protein
VEQFRRYYSNAEWFGEASLANQDWYRPSAAGETTWESAGEFIVPCSGTITLFDDSGGIVIRRASERP